MAAADGLGWRQRWARWLPGGGDQDSAAAFERMLRREDRRQARQLKASLGGHAAGLGGLGSGGTWLRLALGLMVAVCMVATGLFAWGWWEAAPQRVHERRMQLATVPLLDDQGRFWGTVRAAIAGPGGTDFDHVPLQGPLPSTFEAVLVQLEDRRFSQHPLTCQIDVPAMVLRWVQSGLRAGGSGVTMQTAKLYLGVGDEGSFAAKVIRVARQLGAACRLNHDLGPEGVLRLYADLAPFALGEGGSVRGLTGASLSLFSVWPKDLTHEQQALLAAAVRRPLRLLPSAAELGVPCARLYPRRGNAQFDERLARKHPVRRSQCRALARARYGLEDVLDATASAAALAALRDMEERGITLVNPWPAISASRLLVPHTRARTLLSEPALAEVRWQLERTLEGAGVNAIDLMAGVQLSMEHPKRGAAQVAAPEPGQTSAPGTPWLHVRMQVSGGELSLIEGAAGALDQPAPAPVLAQALIAVACNSISAHGHRPTLEPVALREVVAAVLPGRHDDVDQWLHDLRAGHLTVSPRLQLAALQAIWAVAFDQPAQISGPRVIVGRNGLISHAAERLGAMVPRSQRPALREALRRLRGEAMTVDTRLVSRQDRPHPVIEAVWRHPPARSDPMPAPSRMPEPTHDPATAPALGPPTRPNKALPDFPLEARA